MSLTYGEKGSIAYTDGGVGESRVALSYALVRGLTRRTLNDLVDRVLIERDHLNDLFSLAFHTRDILEGKGERQLFYWFLLKLFDHFPTQVLRVMKLIPVYGSWQDLRQLWEMTRLLDHKSDIADRCVELFVQQLKLENEKLMSDPPNSTVTLCAKWAPRETGHYRRMAHEIASRLCPQLNINRTMQAYRQILRRIVRHLDIPETHMCEGTWSEIQPSKVPGRCLKVHRKAFLNQKVDNGTERSTLPDRRICRDHFIEALQQAVVDSGSVKIHGASLFPHELVHEYRKMIVSHYLRNPKPDRESLKIIDDLVLEAQFLAMVQKYRQSGALGSMVVLADVSGSMYGRPLEVCIGLAALISRVNHPAFRDRYMTFSEFPQWHLLDPSWSLGRIVQECLNDQNWNMTTNFEKAMNLVLQTAIDQRLSTQEMPKYLLVLSDMQFDQATGEGLYGKNHTKDDHDDNYHWQMIQKSYNRHGYVPPTIIFWNLRGDTNNFPATGFTPGVEMISGFSPTLLKLFLEEQPNVQLASHQTEHPSNTPYETFRKQIDSPRYDLVRETLFQC